MTGYSNNSNQCTRAATDSDSSEAVEFWDVGVPKGTVVLEIIWLGSCVATGICLLWDGFRHDDKSHFLLAYGCVLSIVFPANTASVMFARRSLEAQLQNIQPTHGKLLTCLCCCCNIASAMIAIGVWFGREAQLLKYSWLCFAAFSVQGVVGFGNHIATVVGLCRSVVQQFIQEIDTASPLDWDSAMAEAFAIQGKIDTLWGVSTAGAPVFFAVFSGAVAIAGSIAFQIQGVVDQAMLLALFSVGCLLAAAPLGAISTVTAMCRDASAGATSVPASASRRAATLHDMSDQEKAAYGRFLLLMRSEANPMGVRFGGVLITTELVFISYIRIAILGPTFYKVAQRLLAGGSS